MRDQDMFLKRALLDSGAVTPEAWDAAERAAREREVDVAAALIETAAIEPRQLALIRADVCEVPFVNLNDYEVCIENSRLLPRQLAERFCIFPLFIIGNVLTVGMDDPMNLSALDQVRQIVRCEVEAVLCERSRLESLIGRAYSLGSHGSTVDGSADEQEGDEADDAAYPVVAAVNEILADAAAHLASDVHINPEETCLRLRYRVDGLLQEKQGPPLSMHAGIVQRLKVMANLDLTQTRRPQDGKFRFRYEGGTIDVRMSTLPTVCGENIVLRLLGGRCSIQSFADLGVAPDVIAQVDEIISQPYGMFIVSGPTGSGKTTTLYTAIQQLNDPSRNIITIEDPVEIRLPYIRQVQVNREIGLTFATALRSILRQDPDIVLLGEIRDAETAAIALQAALTGHMVLSTLHTNDAAGAVSRLRDYGLPAFVINSAVRGVIAQRLVRRICAHCTVEDQPPARLLQRFGLDPDTGEAGGFRRGRGCPRCTRTGYHGRAGLYELLRFTPRLMQMIDEGAPTEHLRRAAVDEGMRLMWQDGLDKARIGLTTLEEVVKAASLTDVDASNIEMREAA